MGSPRILTSVGDGWGPCVFLLETSPGLCMENWSSWERSLKAGGRHLGRLPPMPPPRVGATGDQEAPSHFSPLSVGSVGAVAVSCPSGPCSPAWAGICTHFTDAETKGQELNLLAWDHQLESPSEIKPSY